MSNISINIIIFSTLIVVSALIISKNVEQVKKDIEEKY